MDLIPYSLIYHGSITAIRLADSIGIRRFWRSFDPKANGLSRASDRREVPEGRTSVGVLTETMTRLRDEIVSSRNARVALRGDLVFGYSLQVDGQFNVIAWVL